MARKTAPLMTELIPDTAGIVLRIDLPVAAYYRQSTDAQVGNVSTIIQTEVACCAGWWRKPAFPTIR